MKIGIYGYGNLGRGVEKGLAKNPDLELVGVHFSLEKKDRQGLYIPEGSGGHGPFNDNQSFASLITISSLSPTTSMLRNSV